MAGKISKPNSSVGSHLKTPSAFPVNDPKFPTNPGGKNLPFTKATTGSSGSKMDKMPSPPSSGNKKLTT